MNHFMFYLTRKWRLWSRGSGS